MENINSYHINNYSTTNGNNSSSSSGSADKKSAKNNSSQFVDHGTTSTTTTTTTIHKSVNVNSKPIASIFRNASPSGSSASCSSYKNIITVIANKNYEDSMIKSAAKSKRFSESQSSSNGSSQNVQQFEPQSLVSPSSKIKIQKNMDRANEQTKTILTYTPPNSKRKSHANIHENRNAQHHQETRKISLNNVR